MLPNDLPDDQEKVSTLILLVPSTIYGVEAEKLADMDDFFKVQEIVENFGTLVIDNL